jgi:hypothetical protein
MYVEHGVYATKLNPPNRYWRPHHEATFADYVTMRPEDNVYFFIRRKIYGIGELVAVTGEGGLGACHFLNFTGANSPINFPYPSVAHQLLWDEGPESVNQRWVCFFRPSPHFFQNGVDMDDVLASNPTRFKMLRAFWKVSFVKVDDEENQALKDIILRVNEKALIRPTGVTFTSCFRRYQSEIEGILNQSYMLEPSQLLVACSREDFLTHEMALEAGLLYQLHKKDPSTIQVFGEWDYLSHQVIASPFKPVDYMDRMDIFGYAYVPGFFPTKSKFLVVEIKKDFAQENDIDQVMKYVDWVKDEYCSGDYSMIKAFMVAYDFSKDVIKRADKVGRRTYTIGHRPARSGEWSDLKLVKYTFDQQTGLLRFYEISTT